MIQKAKELKIGFIFKTTNLIINKIIKIRAEYIMRSTTNTEYAINERLKYGENSNAAITIISANQHELGIVLSTNFKLT